MYTTLLDSRVQTARGDPTHRCGPWVSTLEDYCYKKSEFGLISPPHARMHGCGGPPWLLAGTLYAAAPGGKTMMPGQPRPPTTTVAIMGFTRSRLLLGLFALLMAGGPSTQATAAAVAAAAASCAGATMNNTGCTMSPYRKTTVQDADACCSKCASDKKCQAWTFHGAQKEGCYLDDQVDCRNVHGAAGGCRTPPCTRGPKPPPSPAPAPPKPIPHPNYCKEGGAKCKNILYLVADDMRSDWGAYGLPVITPNLDKLASKSMLFEHAYCQLSVCAPSRMSFMVYARPAPDLHPPPPPTKGKAFGTAVGPAPPPPPPAPDLPAPPPPRRPSAPTPTGCGTSSTRTRHPPRPPPATFGTTGTSHWGWGRPSTRHLVRGTRTPTGPWTSSPTTPTAWGSGAASVASFLTAVFTEIYPCNVCSCQEILRRYGRG
jgi:hypothetical protein